MAIKNKQIILFAFIITSLALANFLKSKGGKRPLVKISKQESAINISDELISVFDLGQRRLLSDFFWITTLLESDLEHYKNKDKNSWMFLRFKTISTLDPLFLRNYQFGGQYLNIVKDDLVGAEIIFNKGLRFYPDDYNLLFNAAFLFAYELGDMSKAVNLYEKLYERYKKPNYLPSLINKLKFTEHNDLELTYKIIIEQLRITKDPILKKKLEIDLYSIKATIDLKCLNSDKVNCNKYDADGNPYINDKKWKASKSFKPYKFYIKK